MFVQQRFSSVEQKRLMEQTDSVNYVSLMLLLRDECALCKRLFRSSGLRRCSRCGKYYCFDCSTYNEEGYIICLNCARRMVSPPRLGTKYSSLSRYLLRRGQYTDHLTLRFAEVEAIIGDNLPFGAVRENEWWTNTRGSPQGRAWIDIGWQVENVDLQQRTVAFVRVAEPKQAEAEEETKPKRKRRQKKVPTPFESKTYKFTQPRRFKPPSKSKIAKAQARLRNVERERAAGQTFKGKLKPRRAYEKRLFKPEAKPSDSTT
jgi:hypothetical protein